VRRAQGEAGMEQLLQLMLEVRVLRLLQLLAVTALVLLLATEPELLLMPVVIKGRCWCGGDQRRGGR
jgi:hypothetical protein